MFNKQDLQSSKSRRNFNKNNMVQYKNLNSVMICILLSLFVANTFGQTKNFSREQMSQDIDTLFSTIEKVHPDMYAVYPKELLDKDIERVKSELNPNGDIFYLYRQITPLVVKLGDGHTSVLPPPFPPFLYPDFLEIVDMPFFPFSVKVTYPDKIILVQEDYTQSQNTIPIGAQIISINNKQADEIVLKMMNYVSGEKDFSKTAKFEQLFIPLMNILYRDSIFNIEYKFNQKMYSIQVKGISHKKIYEKPLQQTSFMSREKYTFRTLPDKNIGIIKFDMFDNLDRFKSFLDSTFQVLQKENIENLIIDIRANGGGNSSLGDEMFQYISPVPFAQFGKAIVKYSDIQKQFHKTNFNLEISNPNGIEIQNESPTLIELRENSLRYKGNVFLLTSHFTFSSAADFAWAFKYFNMGTVIGEETGGMAVSFGDMVTQKLPNSGLIYGISFKKFYSYGATDNDVHGTLPDYNIEADKALEFTINLITREK